jgi:hypothetical protein
LTAIDTATTCSVEMVSRTFRIGKKDNDLPLTRAASATNEIGKEARGSEKCKREERRGGREWGIDDKVAQLLYKFERAVRAYPE